MSVLEACACARGGWSVKGLALLMGSSLSLCGLPTTATCISLSSEGKKVYTKGVCSSETSLRLLIALNSEDRGLKVRFSLATIVFETFELILCQMLSSQGKNAPSNPYPHYLVRLATSRKLGVQKLTRSGLKGVSERDFWKTNLPFSRLLKILHLRGEICLQNTHFYKQKVPCLKNPLNWTGSVFLLLRKRVPFKTLTSLNKEVRPFFLGDNSIWRFPSVSSLSDYSIWRSWRLFLPCDHSIWSIWAHRPQLLLSLRRKGNEGV